MQIGESMDETIESVEVEIVDESEEVELWQLNPPHGYCQCGCGELAPIATMTSKKMGWIKGKPKKYIHNHHNRKSPLFIVNEETGCWEWCGWKDKDGYGRIRVGGVIYRGAHNYFYTKKHGQLPEGTLLDHLCKNPSCVNPKHLEPVTPLENYRRGKNTRLTAIEVIKLRATRFSSVAERKKYAAFLGISDKHLRSILNRKFWKEI